MNNPTNSKQHYSPHTDRLELKAPENCCTHLGNGCQITDSATQIKNKLSKRGKANRNQRSTKSQGSFTVTEVELAPKVSKDGSLITKLNENVFSQKNSDDFNEEDFHSLNSLFIDSHTHTDFIYRNLWRSNMIEEGCGLQEWMRQYPKAFPKNFAGCIVNFIEPELYVNIEMTIEHYDPDWILQEMNFHVYLGSTFGCHPHHAEKWENSDEFWTKFEAILSNSRDELKIVGIGECGLDLYKSECSVESQLRVFRRHIQLAFQYDLTLVIHCRGTKHNNAEIKCLEMLKEEMSRKDKGHNQNLRIHRHCYTEDWNNAQQWIRFCPNIVFGYTNAVFSFTECQLEAVRMIPLDRILLETDAPYFKPLQLDRVSPPKCSMPGMASTVAFKIATVKQIPVEEVLRATYNNTRRIYHLPI